MTDEQPPGHQTSRTHGPDGRFVTDEATVRRDAEAARLRSRGWSYQRIADELGMSQSAAHEAVQRALKAIVEEPATEVRVLELERLDRMYDAVLQVLERQHVTVSQGRVVKIDGKPVEDDAPVLAAVDRLLKIQQRRAALLGLDAPSKQEVGGKLTYEILGVDLDQL